MTLILSALCKDGICVCADRRYIIKDQNGSKRFEDNHNKIYKFKDIDLIIFNHGINRFSGKSWRQLCANYESSKRWPRQDLIQIADDFKDFVDAEVSSELKKKQDDFVGFVICGKTPHDSKFKIKEYFWSLDSSNKLQCQPVRHKGGLVRTGTGAKYLEKYINSNGNLNTIDYWRKMSIFQAAKELKNLFEFAVKEKKRLAGKGFSDKCDIGYV